MNLSRLFCLDKFELIKTKENNYNHKYIYFRDNLNRSIMKMASNKGYTGFTTYVSLFFGIDNEKCYKALFATVYISREAQ